MRIGLVALCAWVSASACNAAIIVDSPQPITRRVTVQVIQIALDNGSSPATVFGNATQRADIESSIDDIWAQAGIDVEFVPTINRYNDTFAYQGNAGTQTRPGSDLGTIFNNARSDGGILSPDPFVINLVMANIVPAFAPLNENTSAGYARVGGNGIVGFVGDGLLTFQNGRDVIASVMAHEIGHNLGLNHTGSGQPNLMSPSGDTEQLNSTQIGTARSSQFARQFSSPLAGDYSDDGTINAADYVVWRKYFGQVAAELPADGNRNGRIDDGDYSLWRTNYSTAKGGSGAEADLNATTAVPEPAIGLVIVAAAWIVCIRGRSSER
jgi:Metallo-peptidase family M12B Reprolysin-like